MQCKDCRLYWVLCEITGECCFNPPSSDNVVRHDRPACRYFKHRHFKSAPEPAPAFRWTAKKICEAVNEAGICYSVMPENEKRLVDTLNAYIDRQGQPEPEETPEPEVKPCKVCGDPKPRFGFWNEDAPIGRKVCCTTCERNTGWREATFDEILADWNEMNS